MYLFNKKLKERYINISDINKIRNALLRLLLANYFALILFPNQNGVKPKEMNDIFPNSWRSYFGIKPWFLPKLSLQRFGLKDMPRIHSEKEIVGRFLHITYI